MDIQAISSLLNVFKKPLIEKLVDIKNEISFLFDDGLPSYIETYWSKFIETKTFLFRDTKVNFFDTYFPLTLEDDTKSIKISTIESLYNFGTFISILGSAGSGKSMLIKYIFLKCLEQNIKIPIFIELRNLNIFESDITNYIYTKILNNRLSTNNNILERILENGDFLFLFDGYDELFSNNKQKITHDIEEFIDRYNKNWFIITSRPNSGVESFPRFTNCFIQPLNNLDITTFIETQSSLINDQEFCEKVKSTIFNTENESFTHYLSNPLLLSMFLLTYRNFPYLPKNKSKFYWNVFDTLVTKHDSFTKKGGWQHERKTKLENEEIENILKWFSYLTFFNGQYSFDSQLLNEILTKIKNVKSLNYNVDFLIYDLTVNIGILQQDGLDYSFPHRSLQEYFVAKLIGEMDEYSKCKIYKLKFPLLSKKLLSVNLNLWNLCEELDMVYFYKCFIVELLDKIIIDLSEEDPFVIINNFYKLTGYNYYINIKSFPRISKKLINVTNSTEIISYLNIADSHGIGDTEIQNILGIIGPDASILEEESEESNTPSYYIIRPMHNSIFIDILIQNKFLNVVADFVTVLKTKKEELEIKIEEYTQTNEDLLAL